MEVICTTDDPCDTLEYHEQIAADDSFPVRVLPAFRPDKGINIERKDYRDYLKRLESASGIAITDLDSLKAAFRVRLDFFAAHGCCNADHGIDEVIPFAAAHGAEEPAAVFAKYLAGEYKKRSWVMQIHFAVLRNPSETMLSTLGPDTGYDVIGGRVTITELASLLSLMEKTDALPRMVIYSVNPSDNAAIGALIGAFQTNSEGGMPRLMQGSAWWFNDNKTGMREQMTSLANLSAFGYFLGMLTDSRSFISYTRHEYFRRILCGLIGEWVENGEYPADPETLANLVMDICYNNTKRFFRF